MARGIDLEAVTPRFASKSIGCCKKFPGRNSIKGIATLTHWLTELSKEIVERLEKDEIENSRLAKQIVVSFTQQFKDEEVASTRCIPLNNIDVEIIAQDALNVIKRSTEVFFKNEQNTVILNPLTLLGISAGKFEEINQQKKNTIKDMFSKAITNDTTKKCENNLKEKADDPKQMCEESESRSSDIASFFTAVKEDETEKDEEDHHIDDEFDCNSNGFMDRFVNTSDDSKPIQNCAPIVNPPSTSDLDKVNETTSSEVIRDTRLTSPSKINSSSVINHEEIEEEQPGPSNQTDYKATYVEFLRPTIPDDFFESCTQCHKKVLTIEIQSHMDMHLAFKLSEEQRLEFRSQLKSKPSTSSSSPPVAKKPKLDRNPKLNSSSSSGSGNKVARSTDSSSNHGSLTKYFVQKTNDVPDASVKCEECGKFIQMESVAEHSDYHTAKKLQMEINSLNVSAAVIGSASSKNTKTKSRTDSTSKKRSIASFFKTTN